MAVKHLYFAYGSNMDKTDWVRWCSENGMTPKGLAGSGRAWLPDYTLKFHYYSSKRKGGAANVVPSVRGTVVPGLVFEVDEETLAILDLKEGSPMAYERTSVSVIDDNGMLREAVTYTVVESRISDGYEKPTPDYVDLIRRSLESNNLPIEHLKNAIDNKSSNTFLKTVFVYGTLRKGEQRSQFMKEISTNSQVGTVYGTLFDHGSYPGLSPKGHTEVTGELCQCRDISGALKVLDEIEGFYSYGNHDNLYYRSIKNVLVKDEKQWAWTFITNISSKRTIIPSGDWKRR